MARDWHSSRLSLLRHRSGTKVDEGSKAFRTEFHNHLLQSRTDLPESLRGSRGTIEKPLFVDL